MSRRRMLLTVQGGGIDRLWREGERIGIRGKGEIGEMHLLKHGEIGR